MRLSQRAAAIEAVRILSSNTRPETIRAKARDSWRSFPLDEIEEINDFQPLRRKPIERRDTFQQVRGGHFEKTENWKKNMANAFGITLGIEIGSANQRLINVLTLADLAGERSFATNFLVPHIERKKHIDLRFITSS